MHDLTNVAIPLTALLVSALTFWSSQLATRNAVRKEVVEALEKRVADLEQALERSRERVADLQNENMELLRRLARLPTAGPKAKE